MEEYKKALEHVLNNGKHRDNRTGILARTVFGYQMRFDLKEGFPATTTKKLAWKSVVSELLWMLEGSSDERRLAEIHYGKPREELIGKNTIWTANADQQGKDLGYVNTDTIKDLGPVYGHQWRHWDAKLGYVDQIQNLLDTLMFAPNSRRHIISAWNADQVAVMALPPCHCLVQFHYLDGELSCQLYQRSCDMFLGVPFNIASYSLLTHIIAQLAGMEVGEFIWDGGDVHIYHNHFEAVEEQLKREPRPLPKLIMPAFETLEDVVALTPADFVLEGYDPHPPIKAEMAV